MYNGISTDIRKYIEIRDNGDMHENVYWQQNSYIVCFPNKSTFLLSK